MLAASWPNCGEAATIIFRNEGIFAGVKYVLRPSVEVGGGAKGFRRRRMMAISPDCLVCFAQRANLLAYELCEGVLS